MTVIYKVFNLLSRYEECLEYTITKASQKNMAAAAREIKENKSSLATAAITFDVRRNTLRSRLTTGSVSNRQLGKGATWNAYVQEKITRHLLILDSKGFGLAVAEVRVLAFQFAEKNGISHKFNSEKRMAGYD
jgi:hypothetical protein